MAISQHRSDDLFAEFTGVPAGSLAGGLPGGAGTEAPQDGAEAVRARFSLGLDMPDLAAAKGGSGGGGPSWKSGGGGKGKGDNPNKGPKGGTEEPPAEGPPAEEPPAEEPPAEEPPAEEPPTGGYDSGAPQYALDAIDTGKAWTTSSITFAFMDTLPATSSWSDFSPFTASQVAATREIFAMLGEVTGLSFTEVGSAAQAHIALGNAYLGTQYGGYAYYPGGSQVGTTSGDVYINSHFNSQLNAQPGNFAYMTLLHEIGHAMGLEHPHEGSARLPAAEDTRQYTVESYNAHARMGNAEPRSFQLYDVALLQEKYGPNLSHAAGDDVYAYAGANRMIETIWDSGGIDTISVAGSSVGAAIDLNAGAFSSVGMAGSRLAVDNVAIAYGVVIENAVGGLSNDRLVGNGAANVLTGGAGADVLIGGGAADRFVFALGDGSDRIEDFQDGLDRIDFGGTGLGFGDLEISDQGDGARVAYGAGDIVLTGLAAADLGVDDFLFA